MIVKSIAKNIEYIPLCDKEAAPKDQTVFIMRHPTLAEKLAQEASNILEYEGEISRVIKDQQVADKIYDLVKSCIIDIRNLRVEGGKTLTWKDPDKTSVINHIYGTVPELFTVLMQQSGLDEEEVKN